MSIEDWKKLGYSDEQAKELERLSHIGDDIGDIDTHVVSQTLSEVMKKYQLDKNEVERIINDSNKVEWREWLYTKSWRYISW